MEILFALALSLYIAVNIIAGVLGSFIAVREIEYGTLESKPPTKEDWLYWIFFLPAILMIALALFIKKKVIGSK